MIRLRDTIRPLIPLALTFLVVLTYDMFVSMVLSGIPRVVVTITLSIVTWYVIARLLWGESDGFVPAIRGRNGSP